MINQGKKSTYRENWKPNVTYTILITHFHKKQETAIWLKQPQQFGLACNINRLFIFIAMKIDTNRNQTKRIIYYWHNDNAYQPQVTFLFIDDFSLCLTNPIKFVALFLASHHRNSVEVSQLATSNKSLFYDFCSKNRKYFSYFFSLLSFEKK